MDLNPKTVPTEELYGYISFATREWKDGLLSTIMRDLGAIPNEAPKWIVLDGDLDANWIESMNSVMDDNRVSCCRLTALMQQVLYVLALGCTVLDILMCSDVRSCSYGMANLLYSTGCSYDCWASLATQLNCHN